jgi:peptidoglycan hydrolase-like protein with peptidoglycan-binding domain
MKNIHIKGLFLVTSLILMIHSVSASCARDSIYFDGFSSKTTCSGDVATTRYYLGNLEITSENYVEQIQLYKEKYATCPSTISGEGGARKTKNSRIFSKVCVQGEQPSKYLIDSKEVAFQEYVLAYFADFFSYYPDKKISSSDNKKNMTTQQTTATTCTNLTKALSKGSENSEVLKLQQFLYDSRYLTSKPNGYFGNGTISAVKKFQAVNGLSQSGLIGPIARQKINELTCLQGSKNELNSNQGTTSVSTTTKSIKVFTESELFPAIIDGNTLQDQPVSSSTCQYDGCYETKKARYLTPDKKNFYEVQITKMTKKNKVAKNSESYSTSAFAPMCQIFAKGDKIILTEGDPPLTTSSCFYAWRSNDEYSVGITHDLGEIEGKLPFAKNIAEDDKKSGPVKYYSSLFPITKW